MPNMPNMPKMPDIFGMNSNSGNSAGEQKSGESEQSAQDQVKQQQHEHQQQVERELATATGAASTSGNATQSETEGGEHAQDKFPNMNPLDIDATKAIGHAKELGSNIGNMLFSFGKNASNNMIKTANHLKDVIEKTSIIGEFTKENEKFVNDKKNQQRKEEAALPPWVGYNEEDKLKEQILELSQDSRNFLRTPPDGVEFHFEYSTIYPIAMATLEEDSNLKDMRFKLVPAKINEENFWRNYFYRVSLIKQSTQLSELNESNLNFANDRSCDSELNKVVDTSSHQIANNEFVSDSYDHDTISADEIKSDLKQLKLDNKKVDDLEDTDWDKELPEDLDSISAEELEKEINQMIGKQ